MSDDAKETSGRKLAPFLNLLLVEKRAHNELMKLINEVLENEIKGEGINAEDLYDKLTNWRVLRNKDTGKALEPIYDLLFTLSIPFDNSTYDRSQYVQAQTIRRRRQGKIAPMTTTLPPSAGGSR